MKSYIYIVSLITICGRSVASGQETVPDTLPQSVQESTLDTVKADDGMEYLQDSISQNDTFPSDVVKNGLDSLKRKRVDPIKNIKISSDSPEEPIDYGSVDSSYLDLSKNQIHLFGDAFVKYGKYNLEAGYIIFDFDKNEASAFDTLPGGLKLKSAVFTDDSKSFTSSGLRYNFKSNKGIIYNAVTSEGEFQVYGKKTKFVSAEADSLSTADQIYNKNAVITTCDAPVPHFGIRSTKLKVVPNRLAVAGFSQLEIAGIPTPAVVPFGFYPLVDGLSSGLIFPADFDSNPELGLGVKGIGYYFPISDNFDLTVTGDFYTRGTHRINVVSKFKKIYKYKGNLELRYANNIIEIENTDDLKEVSNKGFSLKISRTQDAKAHPYRSISGSVNMSVGDFYATNFNDPESALKKEYGSEFTFKNSLPGTPFSLIVAMSHNQNTRTGDMNITLPRAKLTMTSITPFKKKIPGSTESWYEKININGSSEFKAFVNAADSTLFTKTTLDQIQTGMYNKAGMSASFKALKFINISPSVSVDQYLYARTLERTYDDTPILDTISISMDQDSMPVVETKTIFGQIDDTFINGFRSLHKVTTGVSMNTQIFGTKKWSRGWLRGLRHTMKPSLSFNYTPSTLSKRDSVQLVPIDLEDEEEFEFYSPYSGGIYNAGLFDESRSMGFSLVNNFEGKYYSKRDSTEKKFKLFQDIRLSTSYNFAADSIKWQPIIISGNTKLTKYSRLNFNARYDFYVKKDGRLTRETIWSKDKRPFEFTSFDLTLTTGFTFKQIFDIFKSGSSNAESNRSPQSRKGVRSSTKSLLETIEGFKIDHKFRFDIDRLESSRDTILISTHQLRLTGKLDLTPMWSVSVNNISYDFNSGRFVYPAFTVTRNLHCWTMNFSWFPESDVYGFFIGVKSSSLNFLKYNYGQQNTNNLGFGR